jgi:molecular chaperone DnaK
MNVRCGIDLGTTYSSISWFDSYNNRVDAIDLETADGAKIVRSVVYYPGPNEAPVIGETAWNAARRSPERVITAIKRAMGSDYTTAPIDGVSYTAPQVSAEILKGVAADAQKYLGEEVKDVVITVPAYFGDNERAATLEAGKLAGLNVMQLLSEPQAAALAFAVEKVTEIVDKYLLVYDLGGGTFDVTLIHATLGADAGNAANLKVDTLFKEGNARLGGLDWDRVLADIVMNKVLQTHGVDLTLDVSNTALLMDNCERAKRHLSRTNNVSIIADAASHQVEVTAAEFEDATRDLVMSTQMLLEKVIEDAGRAPHNIPKDSIEVLLTGGSSKMPMIRKMIQGVLGRPPLQHKNPELLVTLGAAYWAHLMNSNNQLIIPPASDGTRAAVPVTVAPGGLTDIATYAVGVEIVRPLGVGQWQRRNAVIVPYGATYERDFTKEFRTSEDGMTEIPITLLKGDDENAEKCEPLMTFTITGLPPDRPAGQRVEVTLRYDSSGVLRGSAVDVATRKVCDIVVDRTKTNLTAA